MSRKCILILVDGMRPDALSACGHPFCREILSTGAVQMEARSVMPSVTLPCHISLFHSVPPSRHGTLTNTYTQQVRPVRSLFEVLHSVGKTTAFFYSWEPLRDIALPGHLSYGGFLKLADNPQSDRQLTDAALARLRDSEPDFTFLYLGETDEAGHAKGWLSPFYLETLSGAWDCIRRVCEQAEDDYDILITADHGGHDRTHGSDCPEDMTIPLFVRTPGLSLRPHLKTPDLLDLAPTICRLLEVPADREWEGASLI